MRKKIVNAGTEKWKTVTLKSIGINISMANENSPLF